MKKDSSNTRGAEDFPVGLVVKNPPFTAASVGLTPGKGTKIPHATRYSQNIKKKKKRKSICVLCTHAHVHVWIYFFLKVSSDKTMIALIPPLVSKWHGFNPSRSISESLGKKAPLGKKAGEGCCLLIQKQDLQSAGLSIFTKPTGDASPQTEMWTTALEAWSQLSDLQGTAQQTFQDFALLLKVSFLRERLSDSLFPKLAILSPVPESFSAWLLQLTLSILLAAPGLWDTVTDC